MKLREGQRNKEIYHTLEHYRQQEGMFDVCSKMYLNKGFNKNLIHAGQTNVE